jgi:hypothetical protein
MLTVIGINLLLLTCHLQFFIYIALFSSAVVYSASFQATTLHFHSFKGQVLSTSSSQDILYTPDRAAPCSPVRIHSAHGYRRPPGLRGDPRWSQIML